MKRLVICFKLNGESYATNSGSDTMPDALRSKRLAKLDRVRVLEPEGTTFEPFITTCAKAESFPKVEFFKKRGSWNTDVVTAFFLEHNLTVTY